MPDTVNLTRAVLDETLVRIVRRGKDPADVLALREPKRAWSYQKLHEESCKAGGALLRMGLHPGDRLALFLHDGGEMAATLLGAIRVGLCVVPLPDTLRPRELLSILADSGARGVVAHADLLEELSLVKSSVPTLTQIAGLGGVRGGSLDFAALCFDADPTLEARPQPKDAPALLHYQTSPDGRVRAHAYPHDVPVFSCAGFVESVLGIGPEDRILSISRLASTFGLGMSLFCPLLAGAVSFLMPDKGRRRAIFDVLGSFRPTVFAATPTVYNHLVREFLEMSVPRPAYFRDVRLSLAAAEPMPATLERRLKAVFGIEPLQCFTAAEGFHVVLSSGVADGVGSCGRPMPGLLAQVLNEQGRPARPAEIGHLQLSGEQLGGGLWCGLTKKMLPAEERWLTLPDRFFVDEGGSYYFAGRADGMFKVDGRLVSPVEVERILLSHPAVWECALIESEDEDGLPIPRAYVVLNVGCEPSSKLARDLMEFTKQQLSPHKVPQAVEFVEQLPRGADGHISRWRLRSRPPSSPLSPVRGSSSLRTPTPTQAAKDQEKPPR